MKRGSRKQRRPITRLQVIAAEKIASEVYDERLTSTQGVEFLAETHKINPETARRFINSYRHMVQGQVFKSTMKPEDLNIFLSKIHEKRGHIAHTLAIHASKQHIIYYEQISNKTSNKTKKSGKTEKMRQVVAEHAGISSPIELTDHTAQFIEQVQKSLAASPASRAKRLKKADKTPAKISIITHAFVRNPDVVAEVLIRANGKCERCKNAAPFKRKTDNSPYLEVHHTVQLSQGGEDTVENAQALCPNCHRLLHHGNLPDPEAAIENVSGTNN